METLNLSTQSTTEGNPVAFNRQYLTIFLGYIDPPFLIVGACTNVLTIIGIVRARTSFSPSIFFYYLMMAIMDFIAEGCYLFNPLTKESIPIWLGLSNIRELASIYNLPTKIQGTIWSIAELYSYYALQLLTIERTFAIFFPFKARTYLGLRFSLIVYLSITTPIFIITIPAMCWSLANVKDPFVSSNGYMGEPSAESAPLIITLIATYSSGFFFYLVPPFISCTCLPILTLKIVTGARKRMQLTRASGNAIHQSEMKTTILTVIIAIISLIIFLPMAFTYTIFLVKANMPSPDISELIVLGAILRTCIEMLNIPHTVNFYIYLWRLPQFRESLFSCCVQSS